MEILQLLLSLLNNGNNFGLNELLSPLKNGELDLKSLINQLNLSALSPLIEGLFSTSINKNRPTNTVERYVNLQPITNFAPIKILDMLEQYFNNNSI